MPPQRDQPATERVRLGKPALSWRRLLRLAHLWIGLILSLPLVALGLTGSILVFEHELDALLSPPPARVAAAGERRPLDEQLAAARAAAPSGHAATFYLAPEAPGDPATIRFAPIGRAGPVPGPGGVQLLIDPVSLEIIAQREASAGLLRQIHMLHANLMTRDRSGREIIGWLGIAMLTLGCSGLVLWWPRRGRWRAAFVVRRGVRGLRLYRDLHGAVGIWGLVVFIAVSFSGVYLAFPQTVGTIVTTVFPGRDLRPGAAAIRVEPVRGAAPIIAERVVALALERVADGRLLSVFLPSRVDQPYRVNLAPPEHLHGAPMITAFIDPWAGRVIEIRDPRGYTLGEGIVAWQHALHAGEALGWVWRLLVFLSGFLPLLFVVTGLSMWLLKGRARQRADAPGSAAIEAAAE